MCAEFSEILLQTTGFFFKFWYNGKRLHLQKLLINKIVPYFHVSKSDYCTLFFQIRSLDDLYLQIYGSEEIH